MVSRWALERGSLIIGRADSNDIVIADEAVSGRHALLHVEHDPYFDGLVNISIEDLGSTNGTFVEGRKIERSAVEPEAKIRIAYSDFILLDPARAAPDQTAHMHDG